MAGMTQEQDGSTSSRRVAALVFPAFLYLGGVAGLVVCAIFGADQWPVIGCATAIPCGVVLQLWLFNLINATNVQEIIAQATKKAPGA